MKLPGNLTCTGTDLTGCPKGPNRPATFETKNNTWKGYAWVFLCQDCADTLISILNPQPPQTQLGLPIMAKTNPSPPPASQIQRIKLNLLDPMPGNREFGSGMDKKSLGELAASVKDVGVKQALLVRPHPEKKGRFQIVFGVRRAAASELAEKDDAPCIVEELTDKQAQELRLIENVQRAGIHEMEEARGYQQLLDLKDEATGLALHTKTSIAEKIGKSEAYVYARLKLLRMPDVAQECFLKGKLSASIVLLICRIPDLKMAYKATLEVADRYGSGITPEREKRALDLEDEPMSFRNAKAHIQNKYMKRLKGAKFDQEDETLVPVSYEVVEQPAVPVAPSGKGDAADFKAREAARQPIQGERLCGGKCSDCPFRTGNMKKLAPDVCQAVEGSTDVCTNTACFQMKEKATVKREQARFRDKGQTLLTEGQARKVLNFEGTALSATDEFLDLRAKVPGKKNQTYEEALEEHLPEGTKPIVARGKKNFLLLPIEDALVAAKKAGVKLEKPEPVSRNGYDPEAHKREEEKRAKRKMFSAVVINEAYRQLETALGKQKPEDLLRFVVNQNSRSFSLPQWKGEGDHQRPSEKEFLKLTEKMSLIELATLLALNNFPDGQNYQGQLNEGFVELCGDFTVDVKAIVEAKGKEQKAAEAKETADKPKVEKAEAKK